jgi:glycerophosphoryl diester phosphodiesterase
MGHESACSFLSSARPVAFAHRGGGAVRPENTLVAFRHALQTGCDVVETDLRLTRDGEIVAVHDDEVARTTDGSGRVEARTLAELRRLDAGYWFSLDGSTYPFRGQGIGIPTLGEVLALAPDLCVNVELKSRGPRLARAVFDFIESRRLRHRFLVAAAHDATIREFRRLARGRIATSAGYREIVAFWAASRLGVAARAVPAFEALQVPLRHRGLTVVDQRFVDRAHGARVRVHVWTIDDPAQMRNLLKIGVDGIMSDHPDRVVSALRDQAGSRGVSTRRSGPPDP